MVPPEESRTVPLGEALPQGRRERDGATVRTPLHRSSASIFPVKQPSRRNVPERPEGVAEDRRLVLLARGGDRAAFESLVVKYAGVVRALTAAKLGRGAEAEAEDAAQDAFLRAFQRLPGLEDPE